MGFPKRIAGFQLTAAKDHDGAYFVMGRWDFYGRGALGYE